MRHTKSSLDSARQSAWFICASIPAAALIVSTAAAGSWHDDFEGGGLDDWVIYNFDPEAESWEEEDGFVVGQIDQNPYLSLLSLKPLKPEGVNADEWRNYTVRVRMRMESEPREDQDAKFGIMLYDRLIQNQYHTILLEYHQAGIAASVRTAEGAEGRETESSPFNVKRGVWYDLHATIETLDAGDRVVYQVNDNPPVTVEWDGRQVQSGGVGLVISDGRFSYDDFVIEGDSIPDGGNGQPRSDHPTSVSPSGNAARLWAELKSR